VTHSWQGQSKAIACRMPLGLVWTAFLALALGCGGTEPADDASRCGTTGEFANTGCGDVVGLVTNADGAGVSGALVTVQGPVDSARDITLVSGPVPSSAAGAYQVRAIRMSGNVPTASPDTVTVWVRAIVPPPPGSPDGTRGARDSVQAILELRPVGASAAVVQAAKILLSGS
jgi:hypothetical protein